MSEDLEQRVRELEERMDLIGIQIADLKQDLDALREEVEPEVQTTADLRRRIADLRRQVIGDERE